MSSPRQSVAVVAATPDRAFGVELTRVLIESGFDAALNPPQPGAARTVVVVLSAWAGRDPGFAFAVASVRSARVVPVRIGSMNPSQVSPFLADLNWILWDMLPPAERVAKLLTAVRLDIAEHRSAQGLEADALAWEASGRDSDYLISDPKRVRHLQALAADALNAVRVSPRGAAYITASAGATRMFRRKKIRRWLFRATAAVAVVVIVVTGVATVKRLKAAAYSDTVFSLESTGSIENITALRAAGALERSLRDGKDVPMGAFRRVTETLSRPWLLATLGRQWDSAVNAVAFAGDSRHIYSADGRGTIGLWDPDTMTSVWRRQVSSEPLYWLFGSTDGRWLATVDAASRLRVFETEPWREAADIADVDPVMLTISHDGRKILYVTADNEIFTATTDTGGLPRSVGRFDSTFDAAQRGDDVVALVRAGEELQIVNADGAVLDRAPVTESDTEEATLGPDGRTVAVAGADGQFWVGNGLTQLRPTGHPFAGAVLTMELSSLGDLAYSTVAQDGFLFDTATGVELDGVCADGARVDRYVVSADGLRVACSMPPIAAVQDIDVLRPLPSTADARMSRDSVASGTETGPIRSIEVLASQLVRVSVRADSGDIDYHLDPIGQAFTPEAADNEWPDFEGPPSFSLDPQFAGTPTVVGVHESGETFVVGSSDGTVTEMDALDNGYLYRTARFVTPDGGPITAVGWSADGRFLVAETGNGNVWRSYSCHGCRRDPELAVDAVAEREPACQMSDALDLLEPETADRLRLRLCEDVPEPEG